MKILKIALQIGLIAQFAFFGVSKIIGTPDMVEAFNIFGYPMWFMVVTGVIEVTAMLCLLYGFVNKQAVYAGAFLLTGLTVGAIFTHIFAQGVPSQALIPLFVLVQNLLMVWLHSRVTETRPQLSFA